jgi:hypothetical protein
MISEQKIFISGSLSLKITLFIEAIENDSAILHVE